MLNENIKKALPDWWKNINKEDNYLIMGDDMDSFLSCRFLVKKFGVEIGGFYDFSEGLYLNADIADDWKEPIFVDCCMREGKCFDNHMSYLLEVNKEMVNPNVITTAYNQKFNGSTLALLLALYDYDFREASEQKLTTLLCIDSWYAGVYRAGGMYADINYTWFERLGLLDYLKPLTDAHDPDYFQAYIDEKKVSRKFHINEDGYITSHVRVETKRLPDCKFELVKPVKQSRCSEYDFINRELKYKDVISGARVFKDTYQDSCAAS
jgi:hypothetical protein